MKINEEVMVPGIAAEERARNYQNFGTREIVSDGHSREGATILPMYGNLLAAGTKTNEGSLKIPISSHTVSRATIYKWVP